MKRSFWRGAAIITALLLLGLLAAGSLAADEPPPPGEGLGTTEAAPGEEVSPDILPALNLFKTYDLKGGYVAKGIGMRNRGYGTITIKGVPAGAKVQAAYLYWGVIAKSKTAALAKGNFNGHAITGTYLGNSADPCWLGTGYEHYAYRANVTSYIKSGINGKYPLKGFASGRTGGQDPWKTTTKPPLMEGASLVIVFKKSDYPLTKIFIYNGSATTTGGTLGISVGPFVATDPVGPVYTTFIGADGQSDASEPGSTCRSVTVPKADWDGTDPQAGKKYSAGNLWDTDTATGSVGTTQIFRPGDTYVTITTQGGPDCLVWVAQVFSISSGTVDTDHDALLDGWEANGYDDNGDYVADVNLPAMGADYLHRDIFVEIDWMSSAGDDHHKPNATVLSNIEKAFKAAPVNNPRGGKGIKIHLDVGQAPYYGGNALTHVDHLGTCPGPTYDYIWSAFDTYKTGNFDSARSKIFHYNIFAHDLCVDYGSVSGISRGIPASDFIVSLGSWPSQGTTDARTGTLIHELGHNLGLTHGGNAGDHENYKPNHLSLMNYSFQVIGVWRDAGRRWDYTRMTINALNENNLNEAAGLNGSASLSNYGTRYYCPITHTTMDDNTADTNVDWNCNGNNHQASVAADINANDVRTTLGQVWNEWANLTYDGGSVGPGMPEPAQVLSVSDPLLHQELTYEMFQEMEASVVQVE